MDKFLKNKFLKFTRRRAVNYLPITVMEIKAIRKQYNLSQRSFADMLDISVRTLQNYELGRIRPSQTATALFNFAKVETKLFIKYRAKEYREFVR